MLRVKCPTGRKKAKTFKIDVKLLNGIFLNGCHLTSPVMTQSPLKPKDVKVYACQSEFLTLDCRGKQSYPTKQNRFEEFPLKIYIFPFNL